MPESNAKKLERLEEAVALQYRKLPASERLARFLAASAADETDEVARLVKTCPIVTFTGGERAYHDRLATVKLMTLGVSGQLHHLCGKLEMISMVTELLDILLQKHKAAAVLSWADGWRSGQGQAPLPVSMPDEEEEESADENDDVVNGADSDGDRDGEAEAEGDDRTDDEKSPDGPWHRGVDRAVARTDVATRKLAKPLTEITHAIAGHLAGTVRAWDRFSTRRIGVSGDTALRAFCPVAADQFRDALGLYPSAEPNPDSERELTQLLEANWKRQIGDRHDA